MKLRVRLELMLVKDLVLRGRGDTYSCLFANE